MAGHKKFACKWRVQVQSLGQDDTLEKGIITTPVSLPGKFHEQRSLAGFRPWGRRESDTTEQVTLHFHCQCEKEHWWILSRGVCSLTYLTNCRCGKGFPGGSDGKASACNAGDPGSVPGSGRAPAVGNSNPLQSSCLENSVDTGAWWSAVHGVVKSRTRLSDEYFFSLFSQSQAFCCSTPRGCTQSVELYFIVSFLRSRTTHPGSLVPTQGPACGLTCHNERMD